MARMARVVADGVPHHITQRGNNRQDVFLLSEDRRFYLETLRANCKQHRVAILGLLSLQKPTEIIPRTLLGQRFLASGTLPYRHRLMTNHVHLVAIPERPDGLARALGQTHGRYAQRFNRRYRRSGHLWQNRFYSCPLGRAESPVESAGPCGPQPAARRAGASARTLRVVQRARPCGGGRHGHND
jgi:putative transposase